MTETSKQFRRMSIKTSQEIIMHTYLEFSPEVADAIKQKKPLLALESTLITHGLPYPQNLETALHSEQLARDQGVTPATIAIMNGKIKIGLTQQDLETLVNDKQAVKASRRDIPYILSKKINAGTTVASTLFCAHAAGIKIFATGGIGGVHRGDAQDISADLIELARTPIAVICAGAKAILDLPRTLEFLETFSVPIIGYRADTLPAFYSASSQYKLPARMDTLSEITNYLKIHWQLDLNTGVLITNPIPVENEISASIIEPVIQNALALAEQKQISGNAITPFLLSELAKTTQGLSLKANLKLIENNVKVGAELARAIMV